MTELLLLPTLMCLIIGIVVLIAAASSYLRLRRSVRKPDTAWLDEISLPFRYEYGYNDFCRHIHTGGSSVLDTGATTEPNPLPVGWQGWEGDAHECNDWLPVRGNIRVVVMHMNGVISEAHEADYFIWKHLGGTLDIVAWRVAD